MSFLEDIIPEKLKAFNDFLLSLKAWNKVMFYFYYFFKNIIPAIIITAITEPIIIIIVDDIPIIP